MKDTLFMTDIERWRAKVLHDLEPRTFRSVRLLATASHERCRKADEFLQELGSILDLDSVLSCLEEWHKQWSQRALWLRVTLHLEEEKLTPAASQSQPQPQTHAQVTQT